MTENKNNVCASFFAGVGGIELGFQEAGFKTIYANEYDPYPIKTYEANFDISVDARDIRDVSSKDVPDHDILLAGFPCQAFSVAGYREGFLDRKGRGDLFFELARIIDDKKPRVLFLENVKNLVGHDRGKTFNVILRTLEELGYLVYYHVLNACQYGNVPQNRERIYILAFREQKDFNQYHEIAPIPLATTLRDVIDFSDTKEERYYYTPDKCGFYEELRQNVIDQDTVYQWRRVYVRANKSGLIPTLTANMGTGGHNVPIIFTDDSRIRKLTPAECFRAQGFPTDYIIPESISNTRAYKQAGNSVVVPVVRRIAEQLKKFL